MSLVALAGCGASPPAVATAAVTNVAPSATASPSSAPPPASAAPAPTTAPSALIEPGAGMSAIYALLGSAKRTIDLVMYELEDARAEELLAADAARGVDVRVILNTAYTGSANDAAFSYLQGHGVHVRWASSLYDLTHQKTLVVDGSVAVIMTLNWTSRYYSDTRDVAILDRGRSDIAAIQTTFNADDDGARIEPPAGADLVWSPTTSLPDLLALINGATGELYVENEEMGNSTVTEALIAAARRGVDVEICMTNSSTWAAAFRDLVDGGVHLRVYAPDAALYIHAKVLVRDPGASDQEAFAGSQNFSTESLQHNRELGIVLRAGTLVKQLQTMIQDDYDGAAPWTG